MEVERTMRVQKDLAKSVWLTAALALTFSVARPASSAWLEGVKKIKIRDKEYPICPEREWVEAGLPLRQVPDEQNAAIEYINAINLYVEEPDELRDLYEYVQQNIWIEEASALLPWLKDNAAAIAAVRDGAKKKDCAFPLLKELEESFVAALLPHLSTMRALARLLVIQGKYLESHKKYREALDIYLAVTRMGYHVSKEPILISGLVGLAVDAIGAKAIEGCVLRNDLDARTLTYVLDSLQSAPSAAQNYVLSLSGEKAFGMSVVDDFFERRLSIADLTGDRPNLREVFPLIAVRSLGLRAIVKADFRKYWNWMDEWNRLPAHIAFRPENKRDHEIVKEFPAWSLAKMLVPALSHARVAFVRSEAKRAILIAQVALEVYRNEKGKYPRTLDQLKGTLDVIPIDPFSNEPLKYRRTEDGYVVYSVNENLVDDQGEQSDKKEDKDIVGRAPLPKPEPFKESEPK
jgi:hypothetical protein